MTSYLVCATPRSGSTLLCKTLAETGVAGDPEEFFEAGDRIVVFVRSPARGKGSGVDVVFRPAHVWTMRAGRAVGLEVFPERQKGLEAVGLSEQDVQADS